MSITERALESMRLQHTRLAPPPTTTSHTSRRSCSSPLRVVMTAYETCTLNGEERACLGKFSSLAGLDAEVEVATPTPMITTSFTYWQNTCLQLLELIRNVRKSSRGWDGTVMTGDAANCSKSATTQVQIQILLYQTHIPNHCLPISVLGKVFMKLPLSERSL